MKPSLILPRDDLKRMIRRRRRLGLDRYDEVWEGVYVMAPLANNEHQFFATRISSVILTALDFRNDIICLAGANISDRPERWTKNFRCPDVAVFLPGNPAEDRATHWLGGPDFAVEVVSRGDRSRKKLDFYSKVGVRELLLVEREPWRLVLYRSINKKLELVGSLDPGSPQSLASEVIPLSFRLLEASERPHLELTRHSDGKTWLI